MCRLTGVCNLQPDSVVDETGEDIHELFDLVYRQPLVFDPV